MDAGYPNAPRVGNQVRSELKSLRQKWNQHAEAANQTTYQEGPLPGQQGRGLRGSAARCPAIGCSHAFSDALSQGQVIPEFPVLFSFASPFYSPTLQTPSRQQNPPMASPYPIYKPGSPPASSISRKITALISAGAQKRAHGDRRSNLQDGRSDRTQD